MRTWCSGLAKSIAERTTTISGEDGAAVESVAIWVHIDPQTRLPARLPEAFHRGFAESAGGHRPRTSLRHPASPPEGAERSSWHFTRADIDIAGHVNNTMYWRLAEELLPPIEGPAIAEAEYRAGAPTGEALVSRDGDMLWVQGAGGEVAATLSLGPRTD